jgi:hypothetical protein
MRRPFKQAGLQQFLSGIISKVKDRQVTAVGAGALHLYGYFWMQNLQTVPVRCT